MGCHGSSSNLGLEGAHNAQGPKAIPSLYAQRASDAPKFGQAVYWTSTVGNYAHRMSNIVALYTDRVQNTNNAHSLVPLAIF